MTQSRGNTHLIILILLSLTALLLVRIWIVQPVAESRDRDTPREMPTTRENTSENHQVSEISDLPVIRMHGSLISGDLPSQVLLALGNKPARWVHEGEILDHGLIVENIDHQHVMLRQNMAYYEIYLNENPAAP